MIKDLMYIELKTGYSDDDPASELYLQMRCNGSISGRVH